VGSTLALAAVAARLGEVVALDNLRRRGSEVTLQRLARGGVTFVHGDIRIASDVEAAGPFDLLFECSAEPSVHAGYDGSPDYLIDTNLGGTITCLNAARRHKAAVVFLSTSRVYPIPGLLSLPLERGTTRLDIRPDAAGPGWSAEGISTAFPLAGHRSLYGATKLASELLIEEYRQMYGLRAIVNRCGVITGPWQMGKVDQGFFVLWAARHLWGTSLSYKGFGGEGLQVRDVMHAEDLAALVLRQLDLLSVCDGQVFNVGGGAARSISLLELTALCEEATGRSLHFDRDPATAPADVPYYVTDNAAVTAVTGWAPARGLRETLADVIAWLREHEAALRPLLAG
jgi:CDP-paratose 2-epimerase